MTYSDGELRKLAQWIPDWEPLSDLKPQITALWAELRKLRTAEAELRARLARTCPLDLSELESRFWSKVDIIDDDHSCWEWTKSRGPLPENYGKFRWISLFTGAKEVIAASRMALFLTTGALPDHACHTCDNPPCCRPAHLYDGTHQANMDDRHARGRYGGWTRRDQRGTLNSQAKLTDEMVISARELARKGMTLKNIYEYIGYTGSQTVLRFAITGRTWKHLNATSSPVLKR
jgi:hypothetical protein